MSTIKTISILGFSIIENPQIIDVGEEETEAKVVCTEGAIRLEKVGADVEERGTGEDALHQKKWPSLVTVLGGVVLRRHHSVHGDHPLFSVRPEVMLFQA